MDAREQIEKIAREMIEFDIANAKRRRELKETDHVRLFGCCGAVVGFIVFMNIVSLIVTSVLFDEASLPHPVENIIFFILLAVLLGISFYNIRRNKKAENEAKAIDERHRDYIIQLNRLNANNPHLGIEPWWDHIKGLDTVDFLNNTSLILTWTAFGRLDREKDGRVSLSTPASGLKQITGEEAVKIMSNKNYRSILNTVTGDGNYKIGELCIYYSSTHSIQHTATMTESEIDAELNAYKNKLDDAEMWVNFVDGRGAFTNEELYYRREAGLEEHVSDVWARDYLECKKEEKIRRNSTSVSHISVETTHTYCPVGIIIIGEDDYIKGILFNHETSYATETYYTKAGYRRIVDTHMTGAGDGAFDSVLACKLLHTMLCGKPNPAGPIKEGLSVEEWAAYIYANYYEKNN